MKKVFFQDNGQRTVNLTWLETETPNQESLAVKLGFREWKGEKGIDGGPEVFPGQSSTWTDLETCLKRARRGLEDRVRKNPFLLVKILEAERALYR